MEGSADSTTVICKPELDYLYYMPHSFTSSDVASTVLVDFILERWQSIVFSTASTYRAGAGKVVPPWWGNGFVTDAVAWVSCTSTGTAVINTEIDLSVQGLNPGTDSSAYFEINTTMEFTSTMIATLERFDIGRFDSSHTYDSTEDVGFPIDISGAQAINVSIQQATAAATRLLVHGVVLRYNSDSGYVTPVSVVF